jgi:hypothetical protein
MQRCIKGYAYTQFWGQLFVTVSNVLSKNAGHFVEGILACVRITKFILVRPYFHDKKFYLVQ